LKELFDIRELRRPRSRLFGAGGAPPPTERNNNISVVY